MNHLHLRRPAALAAAAWIAFATCSCGPGTRRRPAEPAPSERPEVRVRGARVMDPDPGYEGPAPPVEPRVVEPVVPPEPPPELPEISPDLVVTLDLVDARAVDALRTLAYQGDVDIVIMSGADRRITVRLNETPWMEAFEAVLAGADLVAEWEGRRARVLTPEQLRLQREARRSLERQRLITEVFPLQNLLAKDAVKTLQGLLGQTARVGLDEETNTLVITETASQMEVVRATVRQIDRVPRQVMIEALIVDVRLTDAMRHGVNWDISKAEGDLVDILQALRIGAGADAALTPGASLGFTLLGDNWTIEGLIDALQSHDNLKVLASPRILAVNNRPATIEIIEEIPFQQLTETSEGGQIGTTDFKEVGVKLDVTPRVADDGMVHLIVAAEQSSSTGQAIDEIPVIQTRRASNTMTVRNGQLIVIGGLRRRRTTMNEDKVPLLGDAWLIGSLFRRMEMEEVETELVIFIRVRYVPRDRPPTERERILADAVNHRDERPLILRTDPLRFNLEEEDARRRHVP